MEISETNAFVVSGAASWLLLPLFKVQSGALAMALLACCKYLKIGPLYGPGGRFSDE